MNADPNPYPSFFALWLAYEMGQRHARAGIERQIDVMRFDDYPDVLPAYLRGYDETEHTMTVNRELYSI